MRKWLVIVAVVVVGLGVAVAAGLLLVYRASQLVPDFYEQALRYDPTAAEDASEAMIEQATALASNVEQGGRWEAVFTAEQINGWLAVDMPRNYSDWLPDSVSDPRVAIDPEQIRIACRVDRGKLKSVVSLWADVYLAEPNVVALRIRRARAGLVPLPLDTFLRKIEEKVSELDLETRWRQADGDPVVEICVPAPRDEDDRAIRINELRLGDGRVYVSGSAESG